MFILEAKDKLAEALSDEEAEGFDPRWSPDGKTIVYERRKDEESLMVLKLIPTP